MILGWFGCVVRERTKLFFNYANKFMIHSFLWFLLQLSVLLVLLIQLCLLIYTHRHQIPLRTALSELIGSNFLFILTVGELHCWLNSLLSWMELFAEHSRKGAGLGDVSCLSQGENCFCSHNSHNISPSWPAAPRGTYEEEANDSDRDIFVCAFLRVKKWEIL